MSGPEPAKNRLPDLIPWIAYFRYIQYAAFGRIEACNFYKIPNLVT